ncbi:energy transducer TonB [Sphingosinicella sp. CPCC 101087]|uniref:energy transducer TonB n=1 Tax=Sphingosinicella sp. CPCC 101087 TaxID=2497754 RepID=UPI001FB0FEF0|nr:energy transducer TonB [Sphingosinicella sp. CPCC 101087]
MMTAGHQSVREKVGSASGALLVQALIGAMILWGLGADVRGAVEAPLRMFDVLPPPPPPEPKPVQPPPRQESDTRNQRFTPREEGGAAPPNLRSQATEVTAPAPVIPLPVTPPIVAAPRPAAGNDPSSGAAERPGPGTGSGGIGDGSGSGAGGGGGGGGGYGRVRPPRLIRGGFRDSDFPPGLGEAGIGGTVSVIFTILPDGNVTDCRITRSSGSPALDETTCRIIERRYFFEPSRDESGRPIRSRMTENHSWIVEDLPPEREPPRRRRGW